VGRVFESPQARSNFTNAGRTGAMFLAKRFLMFLLTTLVAGLFPVRRANLRNPIRALRIEQFDRIIDRRGFRMIRRVCFRQGKDLAENLRQTLRSLAWHSHQFPDAANVKLCLLLRFSFRLMFAPLGHGSIPVQWHDNAEPGQSELGCRDSTGRVFE